MENDRSHSHRSHSHGVRRPINSVDSNDQHVVQLKRLLSRFSKTELLSDIPDTCDITMNSVDSARGLYKDQIVDRLVSLIQDQVEDLEDIIPLLQLKYTQSHAKSRIWNVLRVENASKLISENEELEDFAESLELYLNRSHFICRVVCRFWQEALWTIIVFNQQGLMQHLFLIHCTSAAFVMYSALRVSHQDVLFRALVQTYRGTAIIRYPVKARDIHSLLRMCIQKSMQQFNPSAFPPDVWRHFRKRKEEKREKLPSSVVDEDKIDLLHRKKYLKENFDSYELPRIESLSYTTKTEYFGTSDEDGALDNSHCAVLFKGQNVLEGLYRMVGMRQAACPLPGYITKVPSSGCNSFLVTSKQQRIELNSANSH